MRLSQVQRAWPALICLLAACADEHLASPHDASHAAGAAATHDAGAVGSEAVASTEAGTVSNASSDAALSCDEQSRASSDAIRAVWAAADNHCTSDDDCVSVWLGTPCYASCAVLTSKAGSAQVTQAAEAQRSTICAGFAERGCKLLTLPCIAPPPFACVAGACRSLTGTSNASDSAPSHAAPISDN